MRRAAERIGSMPKRFYAGVIAMSDSVGTAPAGPLPTLRDQSARGVISEGSKL